ncbi:MAG: sulfite exporter TauE/SafE family protein [Gammaproteobacteria bacterium]|nr:sulfite exporter TauE/SafE family protein [Gammaproteobacteria bacterium]
MDWSLLILPVAAFFTSALTGVVGMGGGLMLLVIMAELLSFSVLIPVHGINQLVMHASRAAISLRSINKTIVTQFALGSIPGVVLGYNYVPSVSENVFKVLLGCFVLVCLVLPSLKLNRKLPFKWPLVGGLTSFCGLFVGATGILIAPFFINEKLGKEVLVASKAACQVFIHATKVIAFFMLGFTLGPYLLLIILMCLTSFAGSILSKYLLGKISDSMFNLLFKTILVLLALRLIVLNGVAMLSGA